MLGPLVFYLALSWVFFADTPHWTQYYYGDSSDPITFIWFLKWWPYAISHGLNPFICKYVWFPQGFNLTWATAVPVLALLAWPVTATAGPVVSYDLLTLAAPALAAWSAYLLAQSLTKNRAAALVAGYLYGFSAYELGQMTNALNMDTIFIVPLVLRLCLQHVTAPLPRRRFIVVLTVLMLAQLGISTEILATFCMFGALAWLIFLGNAPAPDRPALLHLAVDVALAACVTILLASPFLYFLWRGLPDVPPIINSPYIGTADLWQFIGPGPEPALGWPMVRAIMSQFTGFTPEKSTELGLPLVIAAALYFRPRGAVRCYRRAFLLITCVLVVCSLGPALHAGGALANLPLPWMLVLHIPMLRSVLPGRFLMYVSLCAALAMALWLARPGSTRRRGARFVLAALACLVTVPERPSVLPPPWHVTALFVPQARLMWSPWPQTAFFTPENTRLVLGAGTPNVLLMPPPAFGTGMAWQLQSGMAFTQSAGYVGFNPMSEPSSLLRGELSFGPLQPDFAARLTAFCATHHVEFILVGSDTIPEVAAAIGNLGWPMRIDHGVEVVKLPYVAALR